MYVPGLDPPVYTWVEGPEVDESIVLVRLPLMAGLDMEVKGFGVSGGEKELSSCATGGERGVLGRGFSRLRVLPLIACFTCRVGEHEDSLSLSSGAGVVDGSPICMSFGLKDPPENEPNFFMPLGIPLKKPRSREESRGSSSYFESDGMKNLDSSEPAGGEVSLSAISSRALWLGINKKEKIYHHLKASPTPVLPHTNDCICS